MNLNVEKARELLKIFGELNEENQNIMLGKALEMRLEQNIIRNLAHSGKPATENNLEESKGQFLDMAAPLMEHWDDMGPNYHAAFAILINEMTNGKLTKEENIDFVVSSRQISITEYIEKHIPEADFEEAKKIYQTMKKRIVTVENY